MEVRLRGRLDPAEMFPAGSTHVQARQVTLPDGMRVRIAESGDRSQPAVLLLHGWGASLYMWRDWFQPLVSAGRYVIAVDLPGHGLSDKPDDPRAYRLESLMTTVRTVIDQEGLESVDIVAQSMAGTIALELALEQDSRVRRTILVNPACFGKVRLQRLARVVSPPIVDRVLPWLVARWIIASTHRMVYGDPSRITPRDEDEYWAPSQFPAFARAMRTLVHEFTWKRPPVAALATRLGKMAGRFHVVLGTRDSLVRDARSYTQALVRAGAPLHVREVQGGGHAVNEERAMEVVALALAFLD
ncbi:MAG: alpha/beta fold hydrolase [bacterium]